MNQDEEFITAVTKWFLNQISGFAVPVIINGL